MVSLLYGGKAQYSPAYQRYVLCKEFGWDYYTYESQPAWFIEEVSIIYNQEGQKQAKDAKRSQRPVPKGRG